MVALSLSQLKVLEEIMLGSCPEASAEIIIDCSERAVYLQWRAPVGDKEYALSKKMAFIDMVHGQVDVLKREAHVGSHQFIQGVTHEISSSKN